MSIVNWIMCGRSFWRMLKYEFGMIRFDVIMSKWWPASIVANSAFVRCNRHTHIYCLVAFSTCPAQERVDLRLWKQDCWADK